MELNQDTNNSGSAYGNSSSARIGSTSFSSSQSTGQGDLRQAASELGQQISQNVSEMAGRASEAAQQSLQSLKQNAGQYLKRGRDKAMQVEQNLESRVHQHPMAAISIAAVAGLFLGMFLKRGSGY